MMSSSVTSCDEIGVAFLKMTKIAMIYFHAYFALRVQI